MCKLTLIELDNNIIFNNDICLKLKEVKCKIDDVDDWDKMKKLSNPYELIHSSIGSNCINKSITLFNPLSRSYFKLVEIIKEYNIIPNDKPITMVSIAEGPGGFIECFLTRKEYNKKNIVHGITLTPISKYIPNWDKLTTLYNTYNVNTSYGDIYDLNTINSFVSNIKYKSFFITADGGFDYSKDFNGQEIHSCRIILAEIILCFKIQELNGNFVCKFFDLFNILTIKLLYILKMSYNEIFIYKPVTSRPANSERYIICKGFKGISDTLLQNLEKMLLKWKDNKIYDIKGIKLDDNFIDFIKKHNISFVNNQIKYLEKTLNLIENNPTKYEYNKIISLQVLNAVNWCNLYNMKLNKKSKYLCKYIV